jgi:hypothetical protein
MYDDKNCLNEEITYFRFLLSLFPMIFLLFLVFSSIVSPIFNLSTLQILILVILVEILGQFFIGYGNKKMFDTALQDNWKHPKKCKTSKCESNFYFPEFISNFFFKFKTIILEPLIMYHFFNHFVEIESGWNCAVKNKQYMSEVNHDAIIVNIYSPLGKEYIFGDGIDLLVTFFTKKNTPFKVYCCCNSQEFFDIVNNPNCKNLWLFGHGARGRIACKDKYVDYSELVNKMSPCSKNKNYVYQLHCNSGCEKSLADYLSKGRGFANYNTLNKGGEVRGYIENILLDTSWENISSH